MYLTALFLIFGHNSIQSNFFWFKTHVLIIYQDQGIYLIYFWKFLMP